jgi:hypothetical protein
VGDEAALRGGGEALARRARGQADADLRDGVRHADIVAARGGAQAPAGTGTGTVAPEASSASISAAGSGSANR